jgi:hypothetical protein
MALEKQLNQGIGPKTQFLMPHLKAKTIGPV